MTRIDVSCPHFRVLCWLPLPTGSLLPWRRWLLCHSGSTAAIAFVNAHGQWSCSWFCLQPLSLVAAWYHLSTTAATPLCVTSLSPPVTGLAFRVPCRCRVYSCYYSQHILRRLPSWVSSSYLWVVLLLPVLPRFMFLRTSGLFPFLPPTSPPISIFVWVDGAAIPSPVHSFGYQPLLLPLPRRL